MNYIFDLVLPLFRLVLVYLGFLGFLWCLRLFAEFLFPSAERATLKDVPGILRERAVIVITVTQLLISLGQYFYIRYADNYEQTFFLIQLLRMPIVFISSPCFIPAGAGTVLLAGLALTNTLAAGYLLSQELFQHESEELDTPRQEVKQPQPPKHHHPILIVCGLGTVMLTVLIHNANSVPYLN